MNTRKCLRCGTVFVRPKQDIVTCPNCGYVFTGLFDPKIFDPQIFDTADNYSGTIAISGSNASAYEAISYVRNMLSSISNEDPIRANYVTPIIDELDKARDLVQKQENELANKQKEDWTEYENNIKEYSDLLNRDAGEPEFQDFFNKVPFFFESKMKRAYPKFSLAGELVPDYLLILHDSTYLFVEIEKPGVKLFTKIGDPTKGFSHAHQQIRDYLNWVINNIGFLRDRECPNLTGDNFKGLLVIGKSSDLNPKQLKKLININKEVGNKYEIKTFDQILNENMTIINNVKKYYKK